MNLENIDFVSWKDIPENIFPHNFLENDLSIKLSNCLMNFMNKKLLVSISAPMVGIRESVIVIRGTEHNYVMFNPRIVDVSEDVQVFEEANPCYPGIIFKISRHKSCRVRFQTPSGATDTKVFNGLSAKEIQHHLDILTSKEALLDRLNWFAKTKAKNILKKGKIK